MNTVILTIILFFNGTTHILTEEIGLEGQLESPMIVCLKAAGKTIEEHLSLWGQQPFPDLKSLSIQCTVKPLKE